METLNALLKEVIPILDGITYTPQIIKTNNVKGEIVVKIEMQKGTVRATVNFTIVGFTTTTQVSIREVVGIPVDNFISIDKATKDTIKVADLSTKDQNGIIITNDLTYTIVSATKADVNVKDDFEIVDSKLRLKANKILTTGTVKFVVSAQLEGQKAIDSDQFSLVVKDYAIVQAEVEAAKLVLDNLGDTTINDKKKTTSQVTYSSMTDLIAKTALSIPNKIDQVALAKVIITIAIVVSDETSQKVSLTILSKGSGTSIKSTSSLKVSQFKPQALTQNQKDIVAAKDVLDSLGDTTINDKKKTTSQVTYSSMTDLIAKTALDALRVDDQAILAKVNITIAIVVNDDTSQKVSLTILSKGAGASVKSTSFFIVDQFKSQSQADVEAELVKIKVGIISGDSTQLPSTMTSATIKDLVGFPLRLTNGVSFSAIIKTSNDTNGTLTIVLTATKNDASDTKEIVISDFDTTTAKKAREDQIAVDAEITKTFAIIGDGTKLPSQMNPRLIKKLIGFPKTRFNDVHFSVVIKSDSVDDAKGQLVIILTAIKNIASETQVITINGFDTTAARRITEANQANVDNEIKRKFTINANSTRLPSQMTPSLIKALTGFPMTTPNDVHFSVVTKKMNIFLDDVKGKLEFTLIASKGKQSASRNIIISGFKTRELTQDEKDVAFIKKSLDLLGNGIINDGSQFANKNEIFGLLDSPLADIVSHTSIVEPSLPSGYIKAYRKITKKFNYIIDPQDDTFLKVIFTISKGKAIATTTIIISGFTSHKLVQSKIDDAKTLLDGFKTNIIDDSKFVTQVEYKDIDDFIRKTAITNLNSINQAIINQVTITINIEATLSGDTSQTVTFTITKNGISATSVVKVSGFALQESKKFVDAAKNLLDNWNTDIIDDSKFVTQVEYKDIDDFIRKTAITNLNSTNQAIINQVTITIKAVPSGDTSQTITFTITKDDISATSVVEVSGFASQKSKKFVDAAKNLLDNWNTDIIDDSKTAAQVEYKDIDDFIKKTAIANLNSINQAIINQVTITIKAIPNGDTSQTVTFTITKDDISAIVIVSVDRFATQNAKQAQLDIEKAKKVLDNLGNTKTNSNSPSSWVTYSNLEDLFKKTKFTNFKDFINNHPILEKVTIIIEMVPSDTSQTVTFTISKVGGISTISTLEVTGFH